MESLSQIHLSGVLRVSGELVASLHALGKQVAMARTETQESVSGIPELRHVAMVKSWWRRASLKAR